MTPSITMEQMLDATLERMKLAIEEAAKAVAEKNFQYALAAITDLSNGIRPTYSSIIIASSHQANPDNLAEMIAAVGIKPSAEDFKLLETTFQEKSPRIAEIYSLFEQEEIDPGVEVVRNPESGAYL